MAASNRQERQQMRQRGAGARKVNDIDFGFSFNPTPRQTRLSARKTPQSREITNRRNSETPLRNARRSSVVRSLRSNSGADTGLEPLQTTDQSLRNDDLVEAGRSSSKRRKTSDDREIALLTPALASISTPFGLNSNGQRFSARLRRTPATPSIPEINEKEYTEAEAHQPDPVNPSVFSIENTQPVESSAYENDKENVTPEDTNDGIEEENTTNPKRKPKKRKSIGQRSLRRKKRSSTGSVEQAVTIERESESESESLQVPFEVDQIHAPVVEEDSQNITDVNNEDSSENESSEKQFSVLERSRSPHESVPDTLGGIDAEAEAILEGIDEVEELRQTSQEIDPDVNEETLQSVEDTPGISKRRPRKRKSITLSNRRRRASDSLVLQTPAFAHIADVEPEGDETYIDDTILSEEPTPRVPAKKVRIKSRADQAIPSIETATSRPTTTKRFPPKTTASSGRPVTERKFASSTYPIRTYRLTNVSALPSIAEENENDLGAADDMQTSTSYLRTGAAPNGVDILAQICRETIEVVLSRLESVGDSASRAELKRKRSAVEAFSDELEGRLFDVSAALENRMTLEARLRKSRKEKADLQARWIDLRRSREDVAVKCDGVRKRHWENEVEGKEKYELSERLHGLELAVDMEPKDKEVGLEFALETVASDVSGGGGGVGLLDRIREFNRQLERTAMVLEGRDLS